MLQELEEATRRPRELAKIKLGVKSKNSYGKEHPDEVPYFVIDPIEFITDKRGQTVIDPDTNKPMFDINKDAQRFIDKFGSQPKSIPFIFASDDVDLVAETRRLWWKGSKNGSGSLVCSGDGVYAIYRGEQRVSDMLNIPVNDAPLYPVEEGYNRNCKPGICMQAQQQGDFAPMCKPTMTLRIMIPEVASMGFFSVQTSSKRAMLNCLQTLKMIKLGGGLAKFGLTSFKGVPMILNRIKAQGQKHSTNFLVNIKVDEARLEAEVLKKKNGQFSSFALVSAPEHSKLLETATTELDMDLIPQSEHGQPQTGDYVINKTTGEILDNAHATADCVPHIVETIPEGITVVEEETPLTIRRVWIESDRELWDLFKELGSLKGVRVTPKKMELTLLKYASIVEAKKYLKEEIENGTPD